MTDYSELSPLERMTKYRGLAEKALEAAAAVRSEGARDHYLFIAAQWAGLATDIELRLGYGAADSGNGSAQAPDHRP